MLVRIVLQVRVRVRKLSLIDQDKATRSAGEEGVKSELGSLRFRTKWCLLSLNWRGRVGVRGTGRVGVTVRGRVRPR